MTLKAVKVPEKFVKPFEQAETYVSAYFRDPNFCSEKGTIEINGERYILVRASSMSVRFMEFIKKMYPSAAEPEALRAASQLLFDMAKAIGISDANDFHERTGVTDPIRRLSAGPIHFAYSGWAYVDIDERSNPVPDENFCMLYRHPQSFEADSWISMRKQTDFCTCYMNAGYSSGWCEASFDIPLVARELTCRARGDAACFFIMSQPDRLEHFIDEHGLR